MSQLLSRKSAGWESSYYDALQTLQAAEIECHCSELASYPSNQLGRGPQTCLGMDHIQLSINCEGLIVTQKL